MEGIILLIVIIIVILIFSGAKGAQKGKENHTWGGLLFYTIFRLSMPVLIPILALAFFVIIGIIASSM